MLTFDEPTHTYRYAGAVVPSVTQVLGVLYSLAGIPPDVLIAAQERGTAVHKACQFYDEGDLDEERFAADMPHLVPYLTGWKMFLRDCQPVLKEIEKPVYNQAMNYCGTPDRWGDFTHAGQRIKMAQIDIKTSEAMHPLWGIQLMAYNHAANRPHARRFTVQLRPDGTYRLREFIDHEDWPVFVACLTVRRWKETHGL